jgi:hypothetical protein
MKFANCSISWISVALDLRHLAMRAMRKATLVCRDPTPRAHQLAMGACDSTVCVAEKVTHDGRGFLSCFSRTRRNRAIKTRGSNSLTLVRWCFYIKHKDISTSAQFIHQHRKEREIAKQQNVANQARVLKVVNKKFTL